MNGPVVEPVAPQRLDVRGPDVPLAVGQLFGVAAQCTIGLVEPGGPPVAGDRVDEGVRRRPVTELPLDLGTEVMRVRLSSVEAVVRLRRHDGEHLPL